MERALHRIRWNERLSKQVLKEEGVWKDHGQILESGMGESLNHERDDDYYYYVI